MNVYIKDLIALRLLMIYMNFLGEEKGGGGCTNAFTIGPLDECLLNLAGVKNSWPYTCVKVFRSDPPTDGSGQNRSLGPPSSKNFFRSEGYSNKANA